jgi:hypothetical protein
VLQVKDNQAKFRKENKQTIEENSAIDTYTHIEKIRGTTTEFETKLYEIISNKITDAWKNILGIIVSNKKIIKSGIVTNIVSYRIMDLKHLNAKKIYEGIICHWGI